ncbi:MAG: hypothetical protein JNN07_16190 [Verrucomicrobiales bacterium]|nr:hypothetical protein [Verrucomicrobiales bacterium]
MNSPLSLLSTACLVALLTGSGCKEGSSPANPNSSGSSGNPVTAPVDYLGAVNNAQKSANNTLSLVGLKQAIQAYQASEGKLPNSLQDLVTAQVIPKLPEAPRGMKFSYDAASGDIKVVPQ